MVTLTLFQNRNDQNTARMDEPSFEAMAEAMLEDEYQSSHPDLKKWCDAMSQNEQSKGAIKGSNLESGHSRKQDNRSVQIQLPPPSKPAKRQRLGSSISAKEVVEAIHNSFTPNERLRAIDTARNACDHDIQSVHNEEIEAGVDVALVKHMVLLLFMKQRRQAGTSLETDSLVAEITHTCDALEMVYRASSNSVCASFRKVGQDLLSILVAIVDEEINRRAPHRTECKHRTTMLSVEHSEEKEHKEDDNALDEDNTHHRSAHGYDMGRAGSAEGDLLLRKAAKILGHLARVGEATKPIAFFPNLLGGVLDLIAFHPYELIPWEARLSSLWTIANLACNTENMQMMICVPGLVNSLVSVACRPLHYQASVEETMEVLRSRAIASRALLNLSWAPENKIPMSENVPLVELLGRLSVVRNAPFNKSRTVRDILLRTRRHAVGALRNLAAAPRRNKIRLCQYNNGEILDILTDAALNDQDSGVKDRALAAIHNLAIHDTAEMMVDRPALVLALKSVLLTDDGSAHDEDSPKSHASGTLLVLERTITPDMSSYENLRDLLEAVNPSVPSEDENDALKDVEATAEV